MNSSFFLVGPLLGFIGMLAGGYWGVGCGWIVVPVMLILGCEPLDAVGIGLLQMIPSTLPTVIRQTPEIGWLPGQPGRGLALPLCLGAGATALFGKTVNIALINWTGSADVIQWLLFAVILVILALTLWGKTARSSDAMPPVTARQSRIALAAGLGTGLISSMVGIGGGLPSRVLLANFFRVPEHYTGRIVRLLVLVSTASGGLTYLVGRGTPEWQLLGIAMLVAAGGMIGFPLGARLHSLICRQGYAGHVHRSFAVVALAMLLNIILSNCGLVVASRLAMPVIAVGLMLYLGGFALYVRRYPHSLEKN